MQELGTGQQPFWAECHMGGNGATGGHPSSTATTIGGCPPAPARRRPVTEEQFYASLGGRCRRGFFKDVAWDEACLATAMAFRVPDRVPCGRLRSVRHRCPTIGWCQSTVTMSKPVVHLFRLHALATLIRSGTPSDGRFRVLDVGSGTGFWQAALAALLATSWRRPGIDVGRSCGSGGRTTPRTASICPPSSGARTRGKRRRRRESSCSSAWARARQHVRGCGRLAPGGLLVVPVVATGTRRQAYLMIRRDLRGAFAPRTIAGASCPSSTRGTSPRDAGALTPAARTTRATR